MTESTHVVRTKATGNGVKPDQMPLEFATYMTLGLGESSTMIFKPHRFIVEIWRVYRQHRSIVQEEGSGRVRPCGGSAPSYAFRQRTPRNVF